MILLVILILLVGTLEIWAMKKEKQNREMIVFIVIAVLSLSLGYFYLSDPYRESLAQRVLSLLGK